MDAEPRHLLPQVGVHRQRQQAEDQQRQLDPPQPPPPPHHPGGGRPEDQELVEGEPGQVVPPRPGDPRDRVLAPPVADRLAGEEPVLGMREEDGVEGHRDQHGDGDAADQVPAVPGQEVERLRQPPARPDEHHHHRPAQADQRHRHVGVLGHREGQRRPGPDPQPGPGPAAGGPPGGCEGGRRGQHHEHVLAQEAAVVERDRRQRGEQPHPPGGALAERPAHAPRDRDQQHPGERDRQPRREVAVARQRVAGGGQVIEERAVVGGVVAVDPVLQQVERGVGVDRLVMVEGAIAEPPQVERERKYEQREPWPVAAHPRAELPRCGLHAPSLPRTPGRKQ